jgi:thiol-disulfide isomerase/thioredoxin
MVLLLYSLLSESQNVSDQSLRPLSIGDTMPNVLIENISNYKVDKVRFEEFKDKLVIIDFWFGACPGCYLAFPKLEQLQKKFNGDIQIITVNYESQKKIDETFKKWGSTSAIYRYPKLPSILNDSIFHRLFAFRYYPHEVWIDGAGIVIAFTGSEAVTEDNIKAILENKVVKMDMKFDDLLFDNQYPVLSQIYPANPSYLKYYSVILNYMPGLSGGWTRQVIDTVAKTVRVTRKNMTVIQLFTDALSREGVSDPFQTAKFDFGKRVNLRIKDSSRYFYKQTYDETKDEWMSKNCYTYETIMPLEKRDKMNTLMLADLEKFFNTRCRIEKQNKKCLCLVRISNRDRIKSVSKQGLSVFDKNRDTTKLQLQNALTKWLLEKISEANKNTPYIFFDDTGYKGLIDIEVNKELLADIPRLRKELRSKYDLDLVEREKKVEILVFEERE